MEERVADERSDDELGDGTASHLSLAGQRCFSGIQECTTKEPVTQNPLVQVEESQLPSVARCSSQRARHRPAARAEKGSGLCVTI